MKAKNFYKVKSELFLHNEILKNKYFFQSLEFVSNFVPNSIYINFFTKLYLTYFGNIFSITYNNYIL